MNWQLALPLILIPVTGRLLMFAVTPPMDQRPFQRLISGPSNLALCFTLGVGVWACVHLLLLQLGVLPDLPMRLFELLLILGLLLACASRVISMVRSGTLVLLDPIARRIAPGPPTPLRVKILLPLLAIALVIAMLAAWTAYLRAPTGQFDAWAIWNLRAHFMYVAGNDWRLAFDPAMAWSHPDYPLLLPLTVWRGWEWAGGESMYWPAIIAVCFAASTVMLLFSFASQLAGFARGGLVVIYLLTLPFFADMATWQYADMPLACYMVAALGATALAWQMRKPAVSLYILAGALAGFAAFTKNEGLVFAGALTLSVAIGLALRKQWRSIGGWLIGLSPGLLCVMVHKLTLSGASDLVGSGDRSLVASLFDAGRHSLIAHRAADIVPDAVQPLLLIALLAALLLAPGRNGLRRPSVLLVTGFPLLMMLLAYDAAYLVSPNDLTWHLNTSLDRLVLQWLPMALLWLALASRWLGAKGYGLGVRRGDEAPGSGQNSAPAG